MEGQGRQSAAVAKVVTGHVRENLIKERWRFQRVGSSLRGHYPAALPIDTALDWPSALPSPHCRQVQETSSLSKHSPSDGRVSDLKNRSENSAAESKFIWFCRSIIYLWSKKRQIMDLSSRFSVNFIKSDKLSSFSTEKQPRFPKKTGLVGGPGRRFSPLLFSAL